MNKTTILPKQAPLTGVYVGVAVILCWGAMLGFDFFWEVTWTSPVTYLLVLLQTHLFTGLFITAHDAMHGTVAPQNAKLNHLIGKICTGLFIFNSYKILRPKHYLHHRHVASEDDPDYHNGHPAFWRWYLDFVKEYVTWWQILFAAITFNVLGIWIPQENLILYWVIPSILSTLQLFYFGTYLPHRGEHDPENEHRARSLEKNHLWAFVSCYFFGYHYEHHDSPATAWWRLWRLK
ncbi:MAG: fatty acid desaturase [Bacteroidia bacterium]|nr:fatty acid desaturase [Bacteroidia bacterium]